MIEQRVCGGVIDFGRGSRDQTSRPRAREYRGPSSLSIAWAPLGYFHSKQSLRACPSEAAEAEGWRTVDSRVPLDRKCWVTKSREWVGWA